MKDCMFSLGKRCIYTYICFVIQLLANIFALAESIGEEFYSKINKQIKLLPQHVKFISWSSKKAKSLSSLTGKLGVERPIQCLEISLKIFKDCIN